MRRVLLLALSATACGEAREPARPPITVYAAASLARPLAAVASRFTETTRIPVRRELAGSLELSRKVSDLGAVPDVLLLADDDVIASLMPARIDWYVRFATSRLVIAFAQRSPLADSLTADNWWRVLARDGVSIGRADSAIAPAGRHALSLLRRAEGYYREPGLTGRLLARSAQRYVRSNAAELAALLEAGEVDAILEYQSVAEQYGFRYVRLPADLAPAVLYGAAVHRESPAADAATEFVAFLLGDEGARIMREGDMDVLRIPVVVGRDVPPEISALARRIAEGRRP